jgi:tetratricopeptide (TPR) repeat protein
MDLALSYQNLSSIAGPSEADDAITVAIRLHQDVLSNAPADEEARMYLGIDYQRRGAVRSDKQNDFKGALQDELRSRDLLQQVADSPALNFSVWAQLSFAHKRVGSLLVLEHRLDEAANEFQAALELDDRMATARPNDANAEYNRTFTYSDLGDFYRTRGEFKKAIEYQRKALAIQESHAAADPANVRARLGVAKTLSELASNLHSLGDVNGALDARLQAIVIAHGLAAEQWGIDTAARDELAKEEEATAELLENIIRHAPKNGCAGESQTQRDRLRKAFSALERLNPPPDILTKLNSLSLRLSQCDSPHS